MFFQGRIMRPAPRNMLSSFDLETTGLDIPGSMSRYGCMVEVVGVYSIPQCNVTDCVEDYLPCLADGPSGRAFRLSPNIICRPNLTSTDVLMLLYAFIFAQLSHCSVYFPPKRIA